MCSFFTYRTRNQYSKGNKHSADLKLITFHFNVAFNLNLFLPRWLKGIDFFLEKRKQNNFHNEKKNAPWKKLATL